MNVQAGAQKEKGTGKSKKIVPVYKKFKDFFDYEEALREAGEELPVKESKFSALSKHIKDREK